MSIWEITDGSVAMTFDGSFPDVYSSAVPMVL